MSKLLTNLTSVIEVQGDGPGGGARQILDLVADVKPVLGGFDKSFGSITRNFKVSPRTNKHVPRPVRRDPPEAITPELSMMKSDVNHMEQYDEDTRLAIYVRSVAVNPDKPLSYDRVDILTDVALESINFSDFSIDEGSEEDRRITVPLNAAAHVLIHPVEGKQLSTSFSNADDCNVTASVVDEDGTIFAVTEDDSVDGYPYLLKSTDDGANWSEIALTALGANDCSDVKLAGDYLIIAAGTTIAVYDKSGVQQDTFTASGAINALGVIDAATIVATGAGGLLLLSEDTANSFTAITSGVATALNSLAIRNRNEFYVGGASGVLLRYYKGTVAALTIPTALAAATINKIALPYAPAGFSRDEEIYIAATTGDVYKTTENAPDATSDWTQVVFPGDGAGSVVDIGFVDFNGQVFYVLHTPVAGSSVVWRDWTGGTGGVNNMESVSVPTNSGMNALLLVDANNAYVFGDIHSAAEMVMKVES